MFVAWFLAKQLEDFLPESRDSRGTRRQLNGWKRGESRDGAKSRRSVPACVGDLIVLLTTENGRGLMGYGACGES
ncbi:hypothetical protein PspLS_05370 [Pyricularia sp. CBS 133598]|nr:hypothetical protein PspLS_05370 [Pyricularia sp. CBS 133598]